MEETDSTLVTSRSRAASSFFLPSRDDQNLCYGFPELPELWDHGCLGTGPTGSEGHNQELCLPHPLLGPSAVAAIAGTNYTIFKSLGNVSSYEVYLKSVQSSETKLAPSCCRLLDKVEEDDGLGFPELEESHIGCYASGPPSSVNTRMNSLEETGEAQESDETSLDEKLLAGAQDSQIDQERDQSSPSLTDKKDESCEAQDDSGLLGDVAMATDGTKSGRFPAGSVRGLERQMVRSSTVAASGQTTEQESVLPVGERAEPTSGYGTSSACAAAVDASNVHVATTSKKSTPLSMQDGEGSGETTVAALSVGHVRPPSFVEVANMLGPDKLAENEDDSV